MRAQLVWKQFSLFCFCSKVINFGNDVSILYFLASPFCSALEYTLSIPVNYIFVFSLLEPGKTFRTASILLSVSSFCSELFFSQFVLDVTISTSQRASKNTNYDSEILTLFSIPHPYETVEFILFLLAT